ncbi:50S ribosomal protein L23 [Candidatus Saganbacteria bacterium CG08_land_8_20_14_0_20_45_16]|uniref:Large ribosomal subunit protein uL23 n=1 Tax=Candidatus Saganbacteria bacterium CG08_land_8_20_14_0_20_45_16 TaxID=2014293 RepID=A0A2H0XXW1_UNCSA|nr:MAG: 50S ribosomal protein L23 [Candidatus Saganbacteria bacterium CG08_land_8_20_14_0_20_45_16]
MLPEQIIIEPLITEKAVGARVLSCYVFKVRPEATKISVAMAIEKLFKVKVKAVNTVKVRPKRKIVGKSIGQTSQWKKAYVTLEPGQKIEELEV